MFMKKFYIALVLLFSFLSSQYIFAFDNQTKVNYTKTLKKKERVKTERVKGHYRKNGKYVDPYYRSKKTKK